MCDSVNTRSSPPPRRTFALSARFMYVYNCVRVCVRMEFCTFCCVCVPLGFYCGEMLCDIMRLFCCCCCVCVLVGLLATVVRTIMRDAQQKNTQRTHAYTDSHTWAAAAELSTHTHSAARAQPVSPSAHTDPAAVVPRTRDVRTRSVYKMMCLVEYDSVYTYYTDSGGATTARSVVCASQRECLSVMASVYACVYVCVVHL